MITLDPRIIRSGIIVSAARKDPSINPGSADSVGDPELLSRFDRTALTDVRGLQRIASAMVAPLRENLNYSSIARQFLQVEALELGQEAIYSISQNPINHLADNYHECVEYGTAGPTLIDIISPTNNQSRVRLGTSPISQRASMSWPEIGSNPMAILQLSLNRLRDGLISEENRCFIEMLGRVEPNLVHATGIPEAAAQHRANGLISERILINPLGFAHILRTHSSSLNPNIDLTPEVLRSGHMGLIWGMNIFVNSIVPRNRMFVFPGSQDTGIFAIRTPVGIETLRDPVQLSDIFVAWEDVAMGLLYPRNIIAVPIN